MLDIIFISVHVLASALMVIFVLLHAGRGGGLSDLFGGGSMGGSMAGSTLAEKNLDRLTIISAVVFTFTTIMLGIRLK